MPSVAEAARGVLEVPSPVHFLGVGGAGMSALAAVLVRRGHVLTGSDRASNRRIRRLEALGLRTVEESEIPAECSAVVRTAAIPDDHPAMVAALARNLPTFRYAEMLAGLAATTTSAAVAGSHGKTTTSAMLAQILMAARRNPSAVIGGDVLDFGDGNARWGVDGPLVHEACEYAGSFLVYRPSHAVITNLGDDHVDSYGGLDALRGAFRQFAAGVDGAGCLVTSAALARDLDLRGVAGARLVTLGNSCGDVRLRIEGGTFELRFPDGARSGPIQLRIPGRHNIMNAAMAAAAAREAFGVELAAIRRALLGFRGVEGRFQILRDEEHRALVDDYAHHPAEIEMTLLTCRDRFPDRRLRVLFQPHLEERTERHFQAFLNALALADELVLMKDCAVPGRDGGRHRGAHRLYEGLLKLGVRASYADTPQEAEAWFSVGAREGDVDVLLGAGDSRDLAHALLRRP